MKRVQTIPLAAIGLLVIGSTAFAQLEANLGALDENNASGYLQPLSSALSGTLTSSVWKSGYVPKDKVSVQLQGNIMGVSFDDADRTYKPTDPTGFQSTEEVDAPTVIGDLMAVRQDGEAGTALYHPGGFDVENFTVAAPQLEVSGVLGSRAIVRWISIDLGDTELGSLDLFGIGVQHSISQYLVDFPIDLAVGGFFQTFEIGDKIIDTTMFQLMVTGSKSFGIIEPYVGLGFDSFDMESNYSDENDFELKVDFDPEQNLHLTGGTRLNMQYAILHAEFNIAAETGVAAGLSLGF